MYVRQKIGFQVYSIIVRTPKNCFFRCYKNYILYNVLHIEPFPYFLIRYPSITAIFVDFTN